MGIDIPSSDELAELTRHRHPGSVSLYIASAPAGGGNSRAAIVHDSEAARVALRSAVNDALDDLEKLGISHGEREGMGRAVRALEGNREFWGTPGRSIAVFLSPDDDPESGPRAFRLMNELPAHTAVGDRFDIGPLVRATTFAHAGWVLALTAGDVRLVRLESDAGHREVELATLPEDASELLERADHDGRLDRHRADGTVTENVARRRYAQAVQDAVLAEIGDDDAPLVLAAASELEPAYREISTHRRLLEQGIDANPAGLSIDDLVQRGRAVLDAHYAERLATWREEFGNLRANGRASSQLSDVARAATAGLVSSLLFDLESTEEGHIDEAGALTLAPEPGPTTYGLVDEIAARVLRTGGDVKAVRRAELPDDSPVAAIFRAAP